jgi:hypothetical protein
MPLRAFKNSRTRLGSLKWIESNLEYRLYAQEHALDKAIKEIGEIHTNLRGRTNYLGTVRPLEAVQSDGKRQVEIHSGVEPERCSKLGDGKLEQFPVACGNKTGVLKRRLFPDAQYCAQESSANQAVQEEVQKLRAELTELQAAKVSWQQGQRAAEDVQRQLAEEKAFWEQEKGDIEADLNTWECQLKSETRQLTEGWNELERLKRTLQGGTFPSLQVAVVRRLSVEALSFR